jgi:hypothetical protein
MPVEAQLALIDKLDTIIASLGGLVMAMVAYRNLQTKSEAKDVSGKLDHITQVTNSTLTEAKERIIVLEGLVRQMIDKTGNGKNASAAQLPVAVDPETE